MVMEKWVLYQSTGPDAGKKVLLQREKVIAGRGREVDIRVNDTQASRKHASLELFPDGALLKDLKSANGTFSRGKKVTERFLRIGDSFSIGKCRFFLARESEIHSPGDVVGLWEIKSLVKVTQVSWQYIARQQVLERDVELEIIRENFTQHHKLTEFTRSVLRKAASSSDPAILPVLDLSHENGLFLVARRLTPLAPVPWQELNLRERAQYLGQLIRFLFNWSEKGISVPLTLDRLTIEDNGKLLLKVPSTLDLYIIHNKLHITVPWYLPYAAPEEFLGAKPSPQSECYRLGVLLYRALTDQLPRTGRNRKEIEAAFRTPPPSPSTHVPFLSKSVNSLLLGMLERTPGNRPSIEEAKEEWSAITFPPRRLTQKAPPRPIEKKAPAPRKIQPAPGASPRATQRPAAPPSQNTVKRAPATTTREVKKRKKRNPLLSMLKTILFLAAQAGIFFLSSYIVYWLLEQRAL